MGMSSLSCRKTILILVISFSLLAVFTHGKESEETQILNYDKQYSNARSYFFENKNVVISNNTEPDKNETLPPANPYENNSGYISTNTSDTNETQETTTPSQYETEQITLKYSPENKGKNYVIWKGDSINASALALQIGLAESESICLFDAETGKWKKYIIEISSDSDDFIVLTWDILIIECTSSKNVLMQTTNKNNLSQEIYLKHTYDQHTGEGNPGYNYIAWSKNEIVKASELAEIIDLKPKWTIGKYDIQSCRWKTYVHGIGLEGTLFDFTIKQFDMIYIKVSEEKTLSL